MIKSQYPSEYFYIEQYKSQHPSEHFHIEQNARVSDECKKYETRVAELERTVQSLRIGVRAGEEQVS